MDILFPTTLENEISENDTENTWTIQVICPDGTSDSLLSEKDIVLALENNDGLIEGPEIKILRNDSFVEDGEISQDTQIKDLRITEKIEIIQTDDYTCPSCLKTYNAKRNLQRHLKMECGKEPQYSCNYCDYKNYRRNEIANHVKKRHGFEILMEMNKQA